MGSPSPSSNVVCIEYGDEREGIGRDDRRTSGSTTTDLEGEVSRTVRLFRDPTAMWRTLEINWNPVERREEVDECSGTTGTSRVQRETDLPFLELEDMGRENTQSKTHTYHLHPSTSGRRRKEPGWDPNVKQDKEGYEEGRSRTFGAPTT